jgi:hypothetical protein
MPQKLAMPRDDDSGLDEHGCIASINNVCKKFNSLLSETLDELRLTLKKSAIVFVDMFAIKYDLVANHKKYGKLICQLLFFLSVPNRLTVDHSVTRELSLLSAKHRNSGMLKTYFSELESC